MKDLSEKVSKNTRRRPHLEPGKKIKASRQKEIPGNDQKNGDTETGI